MATPAAFVGREAELSRLLAALDNQTRMVLVVGDAGVGKTRLAGEAMARAAVTGMVTVHGAGAALVVEDVHWADSASLDFLTFLTRAGYRDTVTVVATCRGGLAVAGTRRGGGEEIRVGPLSRAELAGGGVTDRVSAASKSICCKGWRRSPLQTRAARASGRNGAELLQQGDAVELRPDVGHATVLETVEVHALDPDRLA